MRQKLHLLGQIDHHLAEGMGRQDCQQLTIDAHKALFYWLKAHQRTQQRSLARTLRPCDTGQLAIFGNQRKPFHQHSLAHFDCGILKFQHA